jgi:hypothetical protein
MNDDETIPSTYEAWRECITVRCGIKLTGPYIDSRLKELRRTDHPRTHEFKRLYGDRQLDKTIAWFEQSRANVMGESR